MNDPLFPAVAAACVVAVASAFLVVVARGAIRAVVALLAHSLSIAALYALLSAGLVATGQVLIYSGAIVVLFLFVVALLPPGGHDLSQQPRRMVSAVAAGLVLLAGLFLAVAPDWAALTEADALAAQAGQVGSVAGIGHELFTPGRLLVPFELTAPLILVAIIGAVTLWRRQGAPS